MLVNLVLLGCDNGTTSDSNGNDSPYEIIEPPVIKDKNSSNTNTETETNTTVPAESNSIDTDDDNDGISDEDEIRNGTNLLVREAKLISYANSRYGSALFLFNADSSTKKIKQLLVDINPTNSSSSTLEVFTVVNKSLFIVADDGIHGRELWVSNFEKDAAQMVDIYAGADSAKPSGFVVYHDKLYFGASTQMYGRELWIS